MKLALVGMALAALSSPHVVARIETGSSPGGATAAYGAVWVANDGSGTLARIDPKTNRVTRRLKLRPGLFSVTHGFGALWVVNYKTGTLTRVDPRSGRVRSVRVGGVPFDVAAAYGRVWVTAWEAGKLVEVDPRSLRVVRRTRDRAAADRPASRRRRASGSASAARRPRSRASTRRTARIERVPVGVRAPSWFVVGTRDLWIKAGDNVLVRVEHGHVVDRLTFGRTLAQGALASDGTLWMPDKELNVVYRVDPKTSTVVDSLRGRVGSLLRRSARSARCG